MSAQPAPPPMFPNTLLAGATRQHLKSASRERFLLATYLLGRTFYFLEDKGTSGICMLKSLLPTLASIQMLKDCDASKQSSVQSKVLICYGEKILLRHLNPRVQRQRKNDGLSHQMTTRFLSAPMFQGPALCWWGILRTSQQSESNRNGPRGWARAPSLCLFLLSLFVCKSLGTGQLWGWG